MIQVPKQVLVTILTEIRVLCFIATPFSIVISGSTASFLRFIEAYMDIEDITSQLVSFSCIVLLHNIKVSTYPSKGVSGHIESFCRNLRANTSCQETPSS